MTGFERIEPETETHRSEKALRRLVPGARLPLARGSVAISCPRKLLATPAGQKLVVLLVHLFARMKGIASVVHLTDPGDLPVLPGTALDASQLRDGLLAQVALLSGPLSEYRSTLSFTPVDGVPDVTVSIGEGSADVVVGADAWRALLGRFVAEARWQDESPLGPYLAAVLAATEVFKRLVRLNFDIFEGSLVTDVALSLYDYGVGSAAGISSDLRNIHLANLAIAGAGAGGTACLYTLASFPELSGEIGLIEPRTLKPSNLGRYLMATYQQVHAGEHKVDSAISFLERRAPALRILPERCKWEERSPRDWGTVVAAVDTLEGRWAVQADHPPVVLDAGVIDGTLYAILRVLPNGWCLQCKHPKDPELTWRRRALRWGITVEECKRLYATRAPTTRVQLERLAEVQNRPLDTFLPLEGVPFDEVPALTECGETPLALAVPSQAPVLPLATTAAGIALAAEVVKDAMGVGAVLRNYFVHDLRYAPRPDGMRFKAARLDCPGCKLAEG